MLEIRKISVYANATMFEKINLVLHPDNYEVQSGTDT